MRRADDGTSPLLTTIDSSPEPALFASTVHNTVTITLQEYEETPRLEVSNALLTATIMASVVSEQIVRQVVLVIKAHDWLITQKSKAHNERDN